MTVTWKDYEGPCLTNTGVGRPRSIENCNCPKCQREKAARMDWATEQNAKERLNPFKDQWPSATTPIPPNPTPAEVLQDLAAIEALKKPWPSAAEIRASATPLSGIIRQFSTGANRDLDTNKLDYEGFLSPLVLEAFATYMNFNRVLADGSVRDSDNWQKGIPLDVYMKSGYRHFIDFWKAHRGHTVKEGIVWAILGLMFNLQGYLHELLKNDPLALQNALLNAEDRRKGVLSGVDLSSGADVSTMWVQEMVPDPNSASGQSLKYRPFVGKDYSF